MKMMKESLQLLLPVPVQMKNLLWIHCSDCHICSSRYCSLLSVYRLTELCSPITNRFYLRV